MSNFIKDKETITITVVMNDRNANQPLWADAGRRLNLIVDKYTFMGHYGRFFCGYSLPDAANRQHCLVFTTLKESIPDLTRELQDMIKKFSIDVAFFTSKESIKIEG